MPMRSSSLANNPLAVTREMDGRYDVVLQVRDNLGLIEQVAGVDFAAILAELESAQDFTGITVVQGETVAWDAVNKILTVPKGDKGDKGDAGLTGPQGTQGIQGPQGIKGDTGLKGDTGSQGPKGFDGEDGVQGPKGDTGDDLTITQITYNGNGTFNWLFSDGTVYVTPSLKGPKGDTGSQGVKGDQGISVHHIKGTSTTDGEGDFATYGEIDTYTVYADADETINLGFFRVNNGAAKEGQYGIMYKSTYDTTANGIVDNSEKLEGRTIAQIQADITDTIGASNGIASLDATTKLDRTQVPAMNVTLEGDVSGSFAVDGSLNTTVNVVVQDNSHSHTFSNLTANPTTLSGYGITNAYTKTESNTSLALKVNNSEKGVSNGLATLDVNGKVVLTQIPDSVLGQLEYMGTWNFATLPTAIQKGQYWIASTSGNGYVVGDWAVWNGATFDKVDNTDAVATVAGRTGNVVLTKSDVGLANVDNTADSAKPISTAQQTALNLKANIASPVFTGNVTGLGVATGTSFNSITGLSSVVGATSGTAAVGTSTLAARQDHVHPVQTTISGNAGTATTLATPRLINGTSFNGSADITVPVNTTQKSDAVSYNIPFVSNITAGNQSLYTDSVSSLTYNPSTNTLATATFAGALAGNAATATRVNNTEVIKFDTGVTEGTDLYTFDGSVSKTINIKAGTNVTLTKTAGSVTINANDTSIAVTEITGMGAGASTFLATPTSTNLAAMLTDETGTGAVVFANSPTLTGIPLATTAVVGTNTTQVATTAYVIAEINKVEEW